MQYDLEKRGKKTLYEYLYECIRSDILTGRLPAGTRLPSKRSFARDQGIAVITVENTYAQLVSEGYLSSRSRSGFYVNDLSEEGNAVALYFGMGAGGSRAEDIRKGTGSSGSGKAPESPVIDLTSGRIRMDHFPFSIWCKLLRRIMSEGEDRFLQPSPAMGIPELQTALSEYLRNAKGLQTDPSHILIGPGTEYLHSVLLQILGGSAITAVEDPGYKKIGLLYEGSGHKCIHIPVDEKGLQVNRLFGSNIRLLHTSPSHHFPTGSVMPVGRRMKLLSWANAEDAYVIEDDYDSEFRFTGKPIPPLALLDSERVIYMNTFTKTLTPSIRIAYMVLPETLYKIYLEKLSYYSSAVSTFEQYTLAAFLGEGYYERHINRMKNHYRKTRKMILEELEASPLSGYATVEEAGSGLHFVLRITDRADDRAFVEHLRTEGIRIEPLSAYAYTDRQEYHHRFLVNYTSLTETELKKALPTMVKALENTIC